MTTLVVERLVAHDSSPAVSIHTHHETDRRARPFMSLQIYYTAHDAGDQGVLEAVARELETNVLKDRLVGSDYRDRLDVYGQPKAILEYCVEHQRGEIASRQARESFPEFPIIPWARGLGRPGYDRFLLVIERAFAQWDVEGGPSFVMVQSGFVGAGQHECPDPLVRRPEDLEGALNCVDQQRRSFGWRVREYRFYKD